MRRLLLPAALLGALASPTGTAAQPETLAIQVDVTDTKHPEGSAGIALWAGEEGFPEDIEHAIRTIYVPIVNGQATTRFDGLAPGSYAVTVFNDRDDDEEFDKNWIGMPRESWGVSNNARPRLRAPRFDEAVFELLGGENATIAIEIR